MRKVILVIDALNECDGCPCLNYKLWYCQADPKHRDGAEDYVPEWCPLKPIPHTLDDLDLEVWESSKGKILAPKGLFDEILGDEDE